MLIHCEDCDCCYDAYHGHNCGFPEVTEYAEPPESAPSPTVFESLAAAGVALGDLANILLGLGLFLGVFVFSPVLAIILFLVYSFFMGSLRRHSH